MQNIHEVETAFPAIRILLVEDEEGVAETLVKILERSGMTVQLATDGAAAVAMKASFKPDIALVDLGLPDSDGIQLVRRFVAQDDCGVIVVSGTADEVDQVLSLELGADDYIAKPPRMRDLLARIRAVHRRLNRRVAVPQPPLALPSNTLDLGTIRVDRTARAVRTMAGEPIKLTSAEFAAIELLALSCGQPVSRDELCETALRRPWRPEDRSVDQLILSLRRKLPGNDDGNTMIQSIRGAGYVLRAVCAPLPGLMDGVPLGAK